MSKTAKEVRDQILAKLEQPPSQHTPVVVQGGDYSYQGWLVALFHKRGGATRIVVEDEHGRLFIHRLEQIGFR